eukprot:CAMPEP_0182477554 /NCGR_PEP_ID=MMETSP1319-20130603/31059_1 /TAXON_ID=172717 /ORGANISM="Bolidomonas pacifica, Strain RCC208" /LENGTH=161 /DNA_ID=CAMNT_0024678801 /DNA_START=30 /DNA_END=515 /DNA_ORIENTATION=-
MYGTELLLVLEGGPSDASGDAVQVLLPDPGDLPPLGPGLLNDLHLLKALEDGADEAGVGLAEVLGAGAAAVGAAVPLLEGADTGAGAKVDLAGDGGGADVVPVVAVGGKLLEDGGLHGVGPVGELELVAVLEVLGVGLDEIGGGDVTDGDAAGLKLFRHFV